MSRIVWCTGVTLSGLACGSPQRAPEPPPDDPDATSPAAAHATPVAIESPDRLSDGPFELELHGDGVFIHVLGPVDWYTSAERSGAALRACFQEYVDAVEYCRSSNGDLMGGSGSYRAGYPVKLSVRLNIYDGRNLAVSSTSSNETCLNDYENSSAFDECVQRAFPDPTQSEVLASAGPLDIVLSTTPPEMGVIPP